MPATFTAASSASITPNRTVVRSVAQTWWSAPTTSATRSADQPATVAYTNRSRGPAYPNAVTGAKVKANTLGGADINEGSLQGLLRPGSAAGGSLAGTFPSPTLKPESVGSLEVQPDSLTTADIGRLDWPVEGTIIYRFGKLVNPDNTSVTWHGIGIAAARGTPVKAVAAGTVAFAEPLSTYGNMIVIQHGGGAYSSYSSLATIT